MGNNIPKYTQNQRPGTTEYIISNNIVYWKGRPIDADPSTFKNNGDLYGSDKSHIFFNGHRTKIKREEISSFAVIKDGFAKTNKNVYYRGTKIDPDLARP